MGKSVGKKLLGFEQQIMLHLRRVAAREESPREAFQRLRSDAAKLARGLLKPRASKEHKRAVHEVKLGVAAYNETRYEAAEKHFRKALTYDGDYARALLYLGNTLYKRGRLTDALTHWHKADEVDPRSEAAELARQRLARMGKTEGGDVVTGVKERMRAR